MNYENYTQLFDKILSDNNPPAPYDNSDFTEYVQLNQKRSERWDKKGEISTELANQIKSIEGKQKWVLITEPWCGDAAHSVPFISKMADLNPNIQLQIQLRDSDSEIDKYLTNGGKSIPVLIVRNDDNEDVFVWGPRPEKAQQIHVSNLNSDKPASEKKVELQKWYNQDKGQSIQKELCDLLQIHSKTSVVKVAG